MAAVVTSNVITEVAMSMNGKKMVFCTVGMDNGQAAGVVQLPMSKILSFVATTYPAVATMAVAKTTTSGAGNLVITPGADASASTVGIVAIGV